MNQTQVLKRYYKEFFISMTFYVILLIASIMCIENFNLPQAIKIIVVLIPVIPTIFVIIAIMRALQDSDELQQKVQLNAITFSAITTGLITFSYGFLENIGFPSFPTIWILPIMFFLWGISLGYFWRKYQ
jgi:ABC-type transport system involved in cytochrome bd biosynthesis fused ATPase/permease subunit